MGKPLIAIQRVQIPPDQSRADRLVASVAIHRVTGGCEAYTARKQAVRIQLRNLISLRCRRCWTSVEGSIWQRPLLRGRAGVAGVSSPGHVSKGIVQEPKRARHLLSNQCIGLGGTWVPEGRPKGTRMDGRAVVPPHTTEEGGEPQGSRKGAATVPTGGKGVPERTHRAWET